MGVGCVSVAWVFVLYGGPALQSFLLGKTILKVSVMVSEAVTVDLQAPTVLFSLERKTKISLFLPPSLSLPLFSFSL